MNVLIALKVPLTGDFRMVQSFKRFKRQSRFFSKELPERPEQKDSHYYTHIPYADTFILHLRRIIILLRNIYHSMLKAVILILFAVLESTSGRRYSSRGRNNTPRSGYNRQGNRYNTPGGRNSNSGHSYHCE